MAIHTPRHLLIGLSLLAASAAWAGQADVRFVGAERFADIGFASADRERALQGLSAHLQRLAERLPAAQTLHVEVLDVDLAGELRLMGLDQLRVLSGGADLPRLHLRYELRQGDRVISAGEDRLSDPAYMMRIGVRHANEPLHFERRMLDGWFQDRFAAQVAGLR